MAETAASTGLTASAVKIGVHRGLKALGARIKRCPLETATLIAMLMGGPPPHQVDTTPILSPTMQLIARITRTIAATHAKPYSPATAHMHVIYRFAYRVSGFR